MLGSLAVRGVVKVLSQPRFSRINEHLSRRLADNTIGYGFFLLGNMRINKATQAAGRQGRLTESAFRKLGYARKIIPYDHNLICAIQKSYFEKIDDPKFSYEQKGKNFKSPIVVSRAINNPLSVIPEMAELVDRETKETIENYYNSYFRVANVQAWRTYHVPPELRSQGEAYSNWWHFDARPIDNTKLFVNLCDVDDDLGPFHMIPASRSREIVRAGYTSRSIELPINETQETQIIKATGPAGAALFCNTELCLHKAGVPAKGRHRDIIQIRFLPSATPLASDWFKVPLPGDG